MTKYMIVHNQSQIGNLKLWGVGNVLILQAENILILKWTQTGENLRR